MPCLICKIKAMESELAWGILWQGILGSHSWNNSPLTWACTPFICFLDESLSCINGGHTSSAGVTGVSAPDNSPVCASLPGPDVWTAGGVPKFAPGSGTESGVACREVCLSLGWETNAGAMDVPCENNDMPSDMQKISPCIQLLSSEMHPSLSNTHQQA